VSKIKFAVVGLGHIGKRHAAMIDGNEESELVAVCDILSKNETGYDGDTPFYQSLTEMLEKHDEIEVLNVCTPNGLHAEQCITGLDKFKHVVVEKPMGLNKQECEEVIFKSLQTSKNVFCVKQNRYSPPSEWIKSVIESKVMGDIYNVQINCFWNRDSRYYKPGHWKGTKDLDGGTLFTQFSHFIDIMYWLFGDIKNTQGMFNDFNHQDSTEFEDSGIVNFEFVNGGTGNLNYSTAVYGENLESSMTIIGEKGSVKIGGQYMDQVVYCNIEGYEMPKLAPVNPPNDYGPYKGSAANHHYVIENVIDTLKGRKTISTNALEGMKVVEIIERIYKLK
jgi:predicted dehydrogenase